MIIANPDSLKPGHQYRITFSDTLAWRQTSRYQIYDATENRPVIDRAYPEISKKEQLIDDSILESTEQKIEAGLFDGLVVIMENLLPKTWYSAWHSFRGAVASKPDSVIYTELTVYPIALFNGDFHLLESGPADVFPVITTPYPSTFTITFYDQVVDTTVSTLAAFRNPINFIVEDQDEGDRLRVLTVDTLSHGSICHGAEIVLLKKIANEWHALVKLDFYQSDYSGSQSRVLPGAGSVLLAQAGQKNFTGRDQYTFSVIDASNDVALARQQMDRIAVVPDPYIASASWEKPLYFSSGRGERRVDFIHLPPRCTIRIFTLDGKLVRTLAHDNPIEDGHHSWDLTSKDGLDVAAGIYIYHIQAPNGGEKIGRFALIK